MSKIVLATEISKFLAQNVIGEMDLNSLPAAYRTEVENLAHKLSQGKGTISLGGREATLATVLLGQKIYTDLDQDNFRQTRGFANHYRAFARFVDEIPPETNPVDFYPNGWHGTTAFKNVDEIKAAAKNLADEFIFKDNPNRISLNSREADFLLTVIDFGLLKGEGELLLPHIVEHILQLQEQIKTHSFIEESTDLKTALDLLQFYESKVKLTSQVSALFNYLHHIIQKVYTAPISELYFSIKTDRDMIRYLLTRHTETSQPIFLKKAAVRSESVLKKLRQLETRHWDQERSHLWEMISIYGKLENPRKVQECRVELLKNRSHFDLSSSQVKDLILDCFYYEKQYGSIWKAASWALILAFTHHVSSQTAFFYHIDNTLKPDLRDCYYTQLNNLKKLFDNPEFKMSFSLDQMLDHFLKEDSQNPNDFSKKMKETFDVIRGQTSPFTSSLLPSATSQAVTENVRDFQWRYANRVYQIQGQVFSDSPSSNNSSPTTIHYLFPEGQNYISYNGNLEAHALVEEINANAKTNWEKYTAVVVEVNGAQYIFRKNLANQFVYIATHPVKKRSSALQGPSSEQVTFEALLEVLHKGFKYATIETPKKYPPFSDYVPEPSITKTWDNFSEFPALGTRQYENMIEASSISFPPELVEGIKKFAEELAKNISYKKENPLYEIDNLGRVTQYPLQHSTPNTSSYSKKILPLSQTASLENETSQNDPLKNFLLEQNIASFAVAAPPLSYVKWFSVGQIISENGQKEVVEFSLTNLLKVAELIASHYDRFYSSPLAIDQRWLAISSGNKTVYYFLNSRKTKNRFEYVRYHTSETSLALPKDKVVEKKLPSSDYPEIYKSVLANLDFDQTYGFPVMIKDTSHLVGGGHSLGFKLLPSSMKSYSDTLDREGFTMGAGEPKSFSKLPPTSRSLFFRR